MLVGKKVKDGGEGALSQDEADDSGLTLLSIDSSISFDDLLRGQGSTFVL
jgi:hypothetical protein